MSDASDANVPHSDPVAVSNPTAAPSETDSNAAIADFSALPLAPISNAASDSTSLPISNANLLLSDDLNEPDNTALTALDQVTSVTQLTDVQSTNWAYQALQSLVE